MPFEKYPYLTCCTEVPPHQVPALLEMIDQAKPISFATFSKHADWQPVARWRGYSVGREKGLKLPADYHVQYFRSQWQGRRCYYFLWSAIEHIFVAPSPETD